MKLKKQSVRSWHIVPLGLAICFMSSYPFCAMADTTGPSISSDKNLTESVQQNQNTPTPYADGNRDRCFHR